MTDARSITAVGWFPVLTLLLGFATNAISERFRDRRLSERERATAEATTSREREAREANRRALLFERRTNFQRETLLNLQDAVVKLARATGRIHHLDSTEHRKTGKWGGQLFPDDLSESALQATANMMVLSPRVRDDRIRELATTFRNEAARVGICRGMQEATEAVSKMGASLQPLHEGIGEVLRKLDEDEEAQPTIPLSFL